MTTSTFILVPGAGGDAFDWHLVVPLLRDAGHEAVAVDLPAGQDGAGLAAYADAIAAAMGDHSDVVLVAQSMGAFSARSRPRAGRLPHRARRPDYPRARGDPRRVLGGDRPGRGLARARRRRGGDPDAPFDLHEMFLHDVPADVAERLLAHGEGGDEGASWTTRGRWTYGPPCRPPWSRAPATACSRSLTCAALPATGSASTTWS